MIKIIIGGIIAAGLLIGGYFVFVRSRSATSPVGSQSTATTGEVAIENFNFQPATLTVKTGASVTWVNQDPTPHSIKSDTPGLSSQDLDRGDQFQFTFTSAGLYNYHCGIHPSMTSKVEVK